MLELIINLNQIPIIKPAQRLNCGVSSTVLVLVFVFVLALIVFVVYAMVISSTCAQERSRFHIIF